MSLSKRLCSHEGQLFSPRACVAGGDVEGSLNDTMFWGDAVKMGKYLRTIICGLVIAVASGFCTAHVMAQEIDLEYRCIILKTPSTVNRTTTLPTGETQLLVNDTFVVEFWATDSGTTTAGLVVVFADLDYPQNLVSSCTPFATSLFNIIFDPSTCNGLIVDELGGSQFSGGVGAAPEWARVAFVEFTADVTGVANVVLNPAQGESAAFGGGEILPANIDYGSCSVPIGVVVNETGACCDSNDTCSENVTKSDCLMVGGRYLGDFLACADDPDLDSFVGCSDICPSSPAPAGVDAEGRPLGDADADCDVDLMDYSILQVNFSGPGN